MDVNYQVIFFSVVIFLVGYQNVAIADQIVNLSLSPSETNLDETTTFTVEFTSAQNLTGVVMHFFVDAEEKGAKNRFYIVNQGNFTRKYCEAAFDNSGNYMPTDYIEKNKNYCITFDYFFDKNSHLGEHYIELKTDFVAENQENSTENFYTPVEVYGNEKKFIFLYPLLFIYFILLIGSIIHGNIIPPKFLTKCPKNNFFKYVNNSIFEFGPEERKKLFSLMVTILPISISIFTLYLTEASSKIGIFFILISFITSFILALYLIKAETDGDVPADNVTIYSLCFLFLGLIEMVMLVLVF